MNRQTAALFDLDGTLTDSKPGILGCLRKALAELDIVYNHPLEPFIGPPVEQWAVEILPQGDPAARRRLADTYRALYDREGWAINSVYSGIPELLAEIQRQGFRLFVCTSKNEPFAQRIVAHFGLDRYFDGVYGDLPDADHEKSALVARLLHSERLVPGDTLMVGDRRYDIAAALANGVRALGAGWGYGSTEELTTAGAEAICPTPHDVLAALRVAETA